VLSEVGDDAVRHLAVGGNGEGDAVGAAHDAALVFEVGEQVVVDRSLGDRREGVGLEGSDERLGAGCLRCVGGGRVVGQGDGTEGFARVSVPRPEAQCTLEGSGGKAEAVPQLLWRHSSPQWRLFVVGGQGLTKARGQRPEAGGGEEEGGVGGGGSTEG
jgi:hypothetical protein